MTETQIPWHQFFFDWFGGKESQGRAKESPVSDLYQREGFDTVRSQILARTPDKPERLAHAYFQRRSPETLLIDEIEHLWSAIADEDDWSLFHAKLDGIARKRDAMAVSTV